MLKIARFQSNAFECYVAWNGSIVDQQNIVFNSYGRRHRCPGIFQHSSWHERRPVLRDSRGPGFISSRNKFPFHTKPKRMRIFNELICLYIMYLQYVLQISLYVCVLEKWLIHIPNSETKSNQEISIFSCSLLMLKILRERIFL